MAKAFDYVERQHKRWLQKMRDRRNTRHETEEDSASPGF